MNQKLTLSMSAEVIAKAKEYLQVNGVSLSKLVEDYFKTLISKKTPSSVTPITQELQGIAKTTSNPNTKQTITEYLEDKYL